MSANGRPRPDSCGTPILRIRLIAVDEAHCVFQWGQDFRPDYLGIADFIDQLPERPVVAAFTATATPETRTGIIRNLRLRDPLSAAAGFDRPNLFFDRRRVNGKTERTEYVIDYARRHPGRAASSTACRETGPRNWLKR